MHILHDSYKKYCSKYKDGMKFLSQKMHKITIETKSFDLVMEAQFNNTYRLYFNLEGLLTESFHNGWDCIYKINYFYNHKSVLISVTCSKLHNYELCSTSEFTYDSKGRIKIETVRHFSFNSNLIWTEQHIHTYNENKEIINILGLYNKDDEFMIYKTYDINHNLIESLTYRNIDEIISWKKNKYNSNGELIRSIILDDKEKLIDVLKYYRFKDGLKSVHLRKSKISNFVSEYHYTIDEKGNWTNKIHIYNGEPRFVTNRTTEYRNN